MNQDFPTTCVNPLPVLPPAEGALFQCPGEQQPISRSVHLARLAAGHVACAQCTHREERGWLPPTVIRRAARAAVLREHELILRDGLRGIYLNMLTREKMSRLVEHVLDLVDERRMHGIGSSLERPLRVVVGHDSRPSSPDLAIGVVASLRRWGGEIGDLGETTRPAFSFSVERLTPDVALFITGGLHNSSWTGLDLLDEQGLPWGVPGLLAELESRLTHQPARRIRTPGTYTPLQMRQDYEASVADHFHAIRPLKLVVGCADPLVRRLLEQLFKLTPCSVEWLPVGVDATPSAARLREFSDSICRHYADAGFLIGNDARLCKVFDERGDELAVTEVLTLLQGGLPPQQSDIPPLWLSANGECPTPFQSAGATEADLLLKQREQKTPLAAEECGRYWLLQDVPRCDAIETVAAVLQTASLSERPLSGYVLARKRRRRSISTL